MYGSQQKEFNHPAGVALTQDGHIVVADCWNDRLQILTVEGTLLSGVGSYGSQPLQFISPWDVALHHNGKLILVTIVFKSLILTSPILAVLEAKDFVQESLMSHME